MDRDIPQPLPRSIRPWPAVALAAALLVPVLSEAAGLFGWTYAPRSNAFFAGLIAALTLVAALLTKRDGGIVSRACAMLVLPASVAAWVSLVPATRWLDVCTLISFAAGWALFVRVRGRLAVKVPLGVLWAALTGILGLFLIIALTEPFGTVETKAYISPDGRYEVSVIEVDEGALGGSASIEAQEIAARVPLLLGEFRKKPEILFYGEWHEFEGELTWLDDSRFEIDGKMYDLP
ncbi:MAG: hypothetical protein IKO07_10600 [Clostridia bacterium]|nr:hypothetical protein [Clostridia bacterium]